MEEKSKAIPVDLLEKVTGGVEEVPFVEDNQSGCLDGIIVSKGDTDVTCIYPMPLFYHHIRPVWP